MTTDKVLDDAVRAVQGDMDVTGGDGGHTVTAIGEPHDRTWHLDP